MDCSCTAYCGNDYDEDPHSERIRKAAKLGKCYECNSIIEKGEEYWFYTIFRDRTISNYKICMTCRSLINAFFSNGFIFGQVRSDLEEYINDNWQDDLPSSCISELPSKAKQIVCDLLQIYQEKIDD